jgi:cell division protein FtsL
VKTSRPVLLVALFLLVGLLTVWQQAETLRLGYRIREREERLAELERDRRRLESEVSRCRDPKTVLERAKALGVDLAVPQDWRVLKPGQGAPVEAVANARGPGRP